jgi:hypothetical protein
MKRDSEGGNLGTREGGSVGKAQFEVGGLGIWMILGRYEFIVSNMNS